MLNTRHQIIVKTLSSRKTFQQNAGLRVPLFLSTLQKSRGSRTNRKRRKALKPISDILASPTLQKDVTNKLTKFQENAQDLLPNFLRNESLGKNRKLVMDGNWWFYNILLALAPGLLVLIVCESYQSEMEEYYTAQNIANKKRIYGDDYVPPHETMVDDSGRVMKLYKSLMEIIDYISGKPIETNVSTIRDVVTEKEEPNPTAIVNDEPNNTVIDSTYVKESSEDQNMSELVSRIENLEKRIGIINNISLNKPMSQEYRLKRLEQSGIQNRVDDRLLDKWRKEERGQRENEKTHEESSLLPSISEAMWMGMKEVVMKKGSEFLDEVGFININGRNTDEAGDEVINSTIVKTIDSNRKHNIDVEKSEENSSANQSIVGQKMLSPSSDVINDGSIGTIGTKYAEDPKDGKSWIRNIIGWKRISRFDIKDSSREDEQNT